MSVGWHALSLTLLHAAFLIGTKISSANCASAQIFCAKSCL